METQIPEISSLVSTLKSLDEKLYWYDRKVEDAFAIDLLQNLLVGRPYLPFSGSALRPYCMAHILNDIIINQRLNIIEFGCGLSTILIARLASLNQLPVKIVSIDHDPGWSQLIKNCLETEKLDGIADVILAPLVPCSLALEGNTWYDMQILNQHLHGKKFDMVIIDGPPAYEQSKKLARFPAFPFTKDFIEKRYSIYLDDVNRNGEQEIIRRWSASNNIRFGITARSMAYYYGGSSFFTEPFTFFTT